MKGVFYEARAKVLYARDKFRSQSPPPKDKTEIIKQ
jgi:hypothetical protein